MDKDEEIAKLKLEIKRLQKIIDSYEKKGEEPVEEDTAKPKFDGIFEGKRVLIVEDILISREIVAKMLEITKAEIDTAETGIEAIEKFVEAGGNYDLILMDIQMPMMDGYKATQEIRKMPFENAKTIPIIAMTAGIYQENVDECLNAGMNAHIGKPLNRDNLINKMAQYFG